MLKGLFISLTLHGLILFWASGLESCPHEELHLEKQVASTRISVTIELNKEQISQVKKSLEKMTQKRPIKKKVIQEVTEKNAAVAKTPTKESHASPEKVAELKNLYLTELRAFIESQKFYPRLAARLRHSGVVEIAFTIDENGKFENIHIHKASGFETLNEAALSLVQKLKSFKPLPKDLEKKVALNIPLRYTL